MNPRRAVTAIAGALFSVMPLLAVDLPREKEKWIAMQVDEFDVASNASDWKTSEIVGQILQMREAVGKVTQLKVRATLPTRVYIFASEASFAPYRNLVTQRKNAAINGAFLSNRDGNTILIQSDATGGVDRIVFHELTHYFVRNTTTGIPLWFNEGIAEYYSTFSTSGSGSGAEIRLGRPIVEHVLWLRQHPLIPLRELFAMDEKSPAYSEWSRQGVFYAESWALVHYLMLSPERHGQLAAFLDLRAAHRPLETAFTTAFHESYEDLERDLRGYVHRAAFQYMRYTGADIGTRQLPKAVAMSRAEVLVSLGHLLAWTRGNAADADAERFLLAAVEADPRVALAHAELGRLYAKSGRGAEADAAFDRATSLGSSNPAVYFYQAETILDRVDTNGVLGPPTPELLKARRLLIRATELAPASAPAWSALGATYAMSEGDPGPGIVALEMSLSLAAGQKDAVFNLIQLYARAGRRDEAARTTEDLLVPTGDRELLDRARDALVWADVQYIRKLVEANKLDEAIPLAKSVLGRTTNPEIRTNLESLINGVEGTRAVTETLRKAIDAANDGKYAEAIAMVDAVLPRITDAEMQAYATKFRAELVAAEAKAKGRKK
ncbi:MAG TPA: hypothetical protein VEZ11_00115 [Thermoanaerobaculia bacterium]|nr:hypothetical protein [Thermoanaerobaculia bacterium]